MTYLLDANVFIQAKRQYYAFDICPGFWESLIRHFAAAQLKSIDRVKTIELERGNDELKDWAYNTIDSNFFASSNEPEVISKYAEIMTWVQNQVRFWDSAKAEFASSIDGWIIAYAKIHDMVVVTHEERAPESHKEVKIPDVCDAFGVDYINTFQMLRALNTRFILPPTE